jgi:rhodanese-related sulfurtransferase
VQELHRRVLAGERPFLLDVRTPEEFAANHVEFTGASISHDLLSRSLHRLPSDNQTPIFTFCRSGHRSEFAAAYLRSNGYPNTYNVTGGIVAWMQAGFETVRE